MIEKLKARKTQILEGVAIGGITCVLYWAASTALSLNPIPGIYIGLFAYNFVLHAFIKKD